MPIYEYRCEACGEQIEQLQRIDDLPLAVCPSCGGALKRVVSAPAFQFKGSGWYVSDYAKKPAGEGAESGTSKSEASPAKSESGSGAAPSAGASQGDSAGAPAKPATKASE